MSLRGARSAGVLLLVVASVCLSCLGTSAPPSSTRDATPGFDEGIILGLFARNRPAFARRNLDEIRALGTEAIGIMIPWGIDDIRATTMSPREDMTPTDRSLRRAIRYARARGLDVFLMPFLYVDRLGEGEWRGTLEPASWKAWFESYNAFILHYAVIAEEEGVDLLSIGSELCSAETRTSDWVELIRETRRVYSGRLTYSANWDHRDNLDFADALDLIGMNAYFELSTREDPSLETLVRAWEPIVEEIDAWIDRIGKPLVLTEVGYPSRRGAASDPWNHSRVGEAAPELQYRLYEAFRKAWSGNPRLEGVYFYLWWGEGGPEDTGYTPRGKPALSVVREWYGD